jgi:hypothetical protein
LSEYPMDDGGNFRPSLTLAFRNSMGKYRSAEFYFRAPKEAKTPSCRLHRDKFVRKVTRYPGIPGTWVGLKKDLDRKLSQFLVQPSTYGSVPEPDQTSFGLERSGPIRPRLIAPTVWVEG